MKGHGLARDIPASCGFEKQIPAYVSIPVWTDIRTVVVLILVHNGSYIFDHSGI